VVTKSERIMLIVNPYSGHGKSIDILPDVERCLTDMGVKVDIRITRNPKEGMRIAYMAGRCGYKKVVALGGDGTVNSVGSGLLGSDSSLAVVPAGVCNDYFKMLGVGNTLEEVCQAVAFGNEVIFDVGTINGQPFFNTMGVGFDAEVAAQVNRSKHNLGKLSYILAVFEVWRKYPTFDIKLRIDNLELACPVMLVAVGIGRSSGGGFLLTPQAIADDGKFDVCVLEKIGRSKIFSILPRTLKGTHIRNTEVKIYRCKQIELFSDKAIPVHYEGETVVNNSGRIIVQMSPEKLKVTVKPRKKLRNES
jgi:diacylglycerol kinase (ATP)